MLVQSLQLCVISEFAMSRYLLFLILVHLLIPDSVLTDEVQMDSAKACGSMHCQRGERCVNRKFWCRNPPCPSMLYCSKTPRESLRGPLTCASVRCSKGYVCLVRVRGCRWDEGCKQQIARCVSEREYREGPASCADFNCPSGHRCILRESAPCKLLKSCAKSEDVQAWHDGCRTLGCPSEYECFVRRPSANCYPANSCKHTPYCAVANDPCGPDQDKSAVRVGWGVQLDKWNPRNGQIYRTPVYVRHNVNGNSPGAGEYQSEERPSDNSITKWLDNLRLKTGVDAIEVWVKQAEESREYEEFAEWLAAVKATLGQFRFEIWLREIRRLTSGYPAFQKWLATDDVVNNSSAAVFPDRKPKLEVDMKKASTDFYPRINYGQNHGYKDRKNVTPPAEVQTKVGNDPSLDYYVLEWSDQRNSSATSVSEDSNTQVPVGFGDSGLETSDGIRNHSTLDHDALFDKNDRRQSIEKDQSEPRRVLEFPESAERRYYKGVYGSDYKVPEIGTKDEKNPEETYALFAPGAGEIRVVSPWETVRVLETGKRTYYTLVGLPTARGNNRMRIIGYPLIVSRAPFAGQDRIFSQDARDLVRNSEPRINAANPWDQIWQRQPVPSPNSDHRLKKPTDLKKQQRTQPSAFSGNEITTTSVPDLSTDSIIVETDYRYECEDGEEASSQTTETKEDSLANEETYYFEDNYQGDQLEINSTDYDFQYNDDEEEYDEVVPNETNVVPKLF